MFICYHYDRPVGSDISQGQQVLSPGMKIRAAEVGILATVGVTEVKCYHTPHVGVMSTGNEVCWYSCQLRTEEYGSSHSD